MLLLNFNFIKKIFNNKIKTKETYIYSNNNYYNDNHDILELIDNLSYCTICDKLHINNLFIIHCNLCNKCHMRHNIHCKSCNNCYNVHKEVDIINHRKICNNISNYFKYI